MALRRGTRPALSSPKTSLSRSVDMPLSNWSRHPSYAPPSSGLVASATSRFTLTICGAKMENVGGGRVVGEGMHATRRHAAHCDATERDRTERNGSERNGEERNGAGRNAKQRNETQRNATQDQILLRYSGVYVCAWMRVCTLSSHPKNYVCTDIMTHLMEARFPCHRLSIRIQGTRSRARSEHKYIRKDIPPCSTAILSINL